MSVDIIADHFAKISNEYEPLNISAFPPNLKDALENPDSTNIPKLEEYQVYKRLCKAKKPNSAVPGDIPKRIPLNIIPT